MRRRSRARSRRALVVLRRFLDALLHTTRDLVDGGAGLLFEAVLHVLHLVGLPDRLDVTEEGALAELHRRTAVRERTRDEQHDDEFDHAWVLAAQSLARLRIKNATRRFFAHAASLWLRSTGCVSP